jgi:diaminopimelate decarboxylase
MGAVNPFQYRRGKLFCEEVPVAEVARRVGTPFYLYSQSALVQQFRAFDRAFAPIPHLTCYAVKANSNLAILSLFRSLGAGFDTVSKGEMMRALAAGADPAKIVFSGVGKTEDEIDLGLHSGIMQFNVESPAELKKLEARARALGKPARIALRVNPGIDARTHPAIATGMSHHKFGIEVGNALEIYHRAARSRHLQITGVACHIGSQITKVGPFQAALRQLRSIFLHLRAQRVPVRHLDLGGGLGIVYHDEKPPLPEEYARAILPLLRDIDCTLLLEPGRILVGNGGILVTRVVFTKQNGHKNFIVVDAGMNDLIRPSLYGANHRIQAVAPGRRRQWTADVVGPICESGDFFARDRHMPIVKEGELLAIMSAGAYGFALASNYNSRTRPPEVLVRKDRVKIIRKREQFQDLTRGESLRPL